MAALYPPILDSVGTSFICPDTNNNIEFSFEMPANIVWTNNNNIHMELLIRDQETGEYPLVGATGDQRVLYIDKQKNNNGDWESTIDNSKYDFELENNYCTLKLKKDLFTKSDTTTMTNLITINNGHRYIFQIRFGNCPLWTNSFATWYQNNKQLQNFGEWSNNQIRFCALPITINSKIEKEENGLFINVTITCTTSGDMPQNYSNKISTAKITYRDNEFNNVYTIYPIISEENNLTQTITAQIPVIPFSGVIFYDFLTENNTILNDYLNHGINLPTRYQGTGRSAIVNDLSSTENAMDDGFIKKEIIFESVPDSSISRFLSIYRTNLSTGTTIKLIYNKEIHSKEYTFTDFLVEMGERYYYSLIVTENGGILGASNYIGTETSYQADMYNNIKNQGRTMRFNSVYLTTNKHQLRLEGNTKIQSLKYNKPSSIVQTIGNKYPYYISNSKNNYRTFQINSLISLQFDPNLTFLHRDYFGGSLEWVSEENNHRIIVWNKDLTPIERYSLNYKRIKLENGAEIILHLEPGESIEGDYKTINSEKDFIAEPPYFQDFWSNQNVYSERKFREAVIEWIQDGKPKLFRSETEGNMIVVLTDVSISPLSDKNRVVWTLACTATEIAEYNAENLIKFNLTPNEITSNPLMSFKNNITRETLFNITEYKILANLFNNISDYLIEKGQIKGELIYEINPSLSDIDYNYFIEIIKQLDIYYLPCSSVPTLNELTEIGKATNNSRFSTIKDSDENLFVMITPPNDINNLNIYNTDVQLNHYENPLEVITGADSTKKIETVSTVGRSGYFVDTQGKTSERQFRIIGPSSDFSIDDVKQVSANSTETNDLENIPELAEISNTDKISNLVQDDNHILNIVGGNSTQLSGDEESDLNE